MARLAFTKLFRFMLITGLLLSVLPVSVARAASFTVNSTLDLPDINPGNGQCRALLNLCTLRAAIMEANALSGLDQITLPAGTFTLTRSGIDDTALNGDLDINDSVIIAGAGAANTIIDANDLDRVFHITGAFSAQISTVTIQDGNTDSVGGGIYNAGGTLALANVILRSNTSFESGAGLFNDGRAKLGAVTVSGNDTNSGGGGIFNLGTLQITVSTISDNSATNSTGGGIGNAFGTLTLNSSTVRDNRSLNSDGGGIANFQGTVTVNNSTISGNTSHTTGGGINSSGGALAMTNSTVSGNSAAAAAGGIAAANGLVNLASVTIANNTSSFAGGVSFADPGPFNFKNTLIGANNGPSGLVSDCAGVLTSGGYNLITNATGCSVVGNLTGNQLNVPLSIGPLQNNGGPTQTHEVFGSAIDGGNPAGCTNLSGSPLTTDQRGAGFGRHADGDGDDISHCDIGAFERQAID